MSMEILPTRGSEEVTASAIMSIRFTAFGEENEKALSREKGEMVLA
ncbi:MAG: hypothetical protein NVSMB27_44200 [Ktedonobacteraceae bacterium]